MSDVRDYNLNRWGFVDDSGTLITIASSNVSIDELNSILGTINIVPNDDNYVLMVNGREAGVISIKSQLKLKDVVYNPDTQSIEFTFDSEEGEKKVSVDVHELVDVYTAGQGLGVDKNQFFIKIDPSSEKYLSVSENGIKISGLDTLLKNLNETLSNFGQETAKAFDQINNVLETSINTINGGIDNEIRPAIAKNADDISTINEALLNKVEYTDVATSENPGRKAIILKNHDVILGTTTTGQTNSLVMMSKWDKADFGSASVTLNLNGKDEHPTYNDNKEIAFVDDIPSVEGFVTKEIADETYQPKGDYATLEALNAEITTRSEADTELQSDITAESTARIQKDSEIEASLQNKADKTDLDTINLVKKEDLIYELQVGDRVAGTINLPKDQFLKGVDYNSDTKVITFTFETTDGEAASQVNISDLVDTYVAGNGLNLTSNEFSIKIDATTQQYIEVSAEGLKIVNIDEKLAEKVGLVDIATEENPNRKAIVLKNHDTILGTTTEGATQNLIMMSKWDKVDVGTASNELNLNGSEERPTYNDDEEIALMKDIEEIKLPIEFNFPIRTLQDKVYTQEEIFAWFGVADAAELKGLIVREGQFYLKYGIQLSGNPYYYKMPIQYIAFETANQIKMVVVGLDTTNDMPTKYEIILNLDGTIAEGNSNIKVTSNDLAFATDMPSLDGYATEEWVNTQGFLKEHQDISNLATKDEVALKANQSDVDFEVNALNDKIDAIKVPTKVGELENDSLYQTKDEVDAAIATKAEQADVDEIKDDLEQFKAPYEINLNALNSAGDTDSEAISTAIGGIDNLRAVISENRSIIGDINNGTVPVSIRILGNITTVYYVLDSLAGYTLNEINIQNTSGTLAKNSVIHSVMSEEMVVDNLTSNESTLPLSAKQGKVLDEKIQKKGMYYQGVKVDTQKLFALTKESTESDIKAALQLETSSGSYTLPTAEILDDCLGKGYQLLSNWMPVSVAWNGAAYVLYTLGQKYMMQPTGLYTVSIKITDGVYSVFQAAKVEEFANTEDLNEYQKIDVLLPEDTFETATAKVANGVKTIIDKDGLQWFITQAYEGVIGSTNALKVIAVRVKSPYVTIDTIQSSYGLVYAQFTLAEGALANSWSKVTSNGEFISEYTINNLIDEKLINVNNAITLLNDKVSILENKYNMILEENSESVADFVGGDTINDTTKSYSVSNANIESNSTINAKNIVLNDSTLSNNARLKVNSNNIEVNNLNISGNFPKENGNSVISLNDADYVVFKDMIFNSNNVYNGVEIGLNSEKLPKNILFENCKFEGTFSNNAILVFGTQNDATITLSNCTFDKLSNALRLSNKSNASGVTVNIINCSVNQWEETNKEYGGFLICEDYTSDTSSVDSNNLFGNGKITVNFMNLTHKGEKVIYSNASRCCGTKDENQVVYVYADNVGFVNYSEDKYPIVTFK